MNFNKRHARKVGVVVFLCVVFGGVSAAVLTKSDYTPFDREFYLTQEQIAYVRPGLNIEVTDVAVATDGTIKVDFTMTDDKAQPLDLDGNLTPGSIRLSFLISKIPKSGEYYQAYITRSVTSPITGNTAIQPTSDSGGTFLWKEDGSYSYTFNFKLPSNYEKDATHTVGYYAQRDLQEYEMGAYVESGAYTWVPNGQPVTQIRQVVTNEACAHCHDDLVLHGRRRGTELCITCHNPGVLDPDTGNSVDLKILVHKIHRGDELENGYTIIGFQQSAHDYSTVAYPQDHRNCETCHAQDAAQAEAYLVNPTRDACGACHDGVNFATGEDHPGGPQISDNFCANCHFPEGELEFDASIKGAHTIPTKSKQLKGIEVELHDVVNTGPGDHPTIMFSLKNSDGSAINVADLNRLRFQFDGPTTDYSFHVTEDALAGAVPLGGGEYSYTLQTAVPEDAEGTYALGIEGRRLVTLNPGTTTQITDVRETMENPVIYFAVTDEEPVPRRVIVDDAKCEQCHENLAMHGSNRHNATAYCQTCHYPTNNDGESPARTIDFKYLVHRIHMGEELTRPFWEFNEVRYPSSRSNCTKCHVGETYNVPTPGVEWTVDETEFYSPIGPSSAACIGCHDTVDAAAHTYLNTAPFGESCGVCHGASAEFAVAKMHLQ